MTNYVPNYEELHYQVHPSQLPWAMHQLSSVPNYNVMGYAPVAGGMCIIVVQVPVGTPQIDWRAPQAQRRRWFRFNLPRLARGLALAVIALALAYIAYGLFVDAASQPTQATPEPSLWDSIAAQLPSLPHGEPVVEPVAPAIEMPWDAAGKSVGDAVGAVQRTITALVVLVVFGAAAFFAFKVQGMFHR